MEDLKTFTLTICSCPGIGPKRFQELLSGAGDIYLLQTLFEEDRLPELVQNYVSHNLDRFRKLADPNAFCCCWEESYPSLLREINDPPAILWFKGNLDAFNDRMWISVVGTRKHSLNAVRWTESFVQELAQAGVGIVSGMAAGIDTLAHRACMESGGLTGAVLGADIESTRLGSSAALLEEIVDSAGVVLSETAANQTIAPGMFARRNRIIAGIAKATLVIEAPERSGALITAHLAFDYGREVFALPGSIDMMTSSGCNHLISISKARLVTDPAQVLQELGWAATTQVSQSEEMSPKLFQLYQALRQSATSFDEILAKFDITRVDALSLLSGLELEGKIAKLPDGRYVAIN